MTLSTEKLASRGLGLLIAYTALSGVIRATVKPFWCDEVITMAMVRLPTMGAIRAAIEHGADSHPPPFYALERLAGRLPLDELIAFRLPSILAFCCVVLCVFFFIRRWRSGVCALICAALPLTSFLFAYYAVEARGYSLMAGFVALAMVSYQRAEKTVWCIVMALSLAAAEASHYYAIFGVIPFALAESAFLLKARRVRFGVWLAMLCAAVPLVIFWPLLKSYKNYYGSHFTGHLSLDVAMKAYGWLFQLPPGLGVGLAVTGIAAVLIYGLLIHRESFVDSLKEVPIQEHVLVLGFLILPIAMYFAIKVVHGGFGPRYLLLTTLGFPLAASYLVPTLNRRQLALFSILLVATLGIQEVTLWRFARSSWAQKFAPAEDFERLADAAGHNDLPLVASDPIDALQLAYYASPKASSRLVFVADAPAAVVYAGSDTADKCLLALRPYLKPPVYEFADFAANHPEFLVYSDGKTWDWWPVRLLHDGYALDVVAMDRQSRERKIYLVTRKR